MSKASENIYYLCLRIYRNIQFVMGVFIKADVEGAETNILAGAKHTL